MNELNVKVIGELERILKQPPAAATADMNSQEKYDYLFECLRKLEAENVKLLTKRIELEVRVWFLCGRVVLLMTEVVIAGSSMIIGR